MFNKHWPKILGFFALGIIATACEDEDILPGTRLAVFAPIDEGVSDPSQFQVQLTEPYVNDTWAMQGGVPGHAVYHLAVSNSPTRRWSMDIGNEENARQKITAQPIIAGNLVYAMDASLNVSAHTLNEGRLVWRVNVSDPEEESLTFGGGLSFGEDKIFVTTGDGEMYALSPRTGRSIWRTRLAGPARSGATYEQGRLFVQTLNNKTEAFVANTGQKIWTHDGIEELTTIIGGSAPAVDETYVYVAYSSGEVYALVKETGAELWTDIIIPTGPAAGRLQLDITDIKALPVVDRGMLYVTSNSGRTVGYDLTRGLPAWEYPGGGTQTPAVSQQHIFIVTNDGKALALDRSDGKPAWIKDLGTNATLSGGKKIEWYGPALVSDRLVFADNRGKLVALSPLDGRLLGEIGLGGGVVAPPSIAQGHMVFITEGADLLAYR